jgi:hypothetical protein
MEEVSIILILELYSKESILFDFRESAFTFIDFCIFDDFKFTFLFFETLLETDSDSPDMLYVNVLW